MVYTSEFPEVSGWYWLKKRGQEEEVVRVLLFEGSRGRRWCRVGDSLPRYVSEVGKYEWKWAGPIEKPEKTSCAAEK